jgi:hypothetical protein
LIFFVCGKHAAARTRTGTARTHWPIAIVEIRGKQLQFALIRSFGFAVLHFEVLKFTRQTKRIRRVPASPLAM